MGKDTKISWAEHTFNPWVGCTKVSPGCDNCYAEAQDSRWRGGHWGKGAPRRVTSTSYWNEPLKWNREAAARGGPPPRVFCGSLCDVMDDEGSPEARVNLWYLINQTPFLLWLLLTKRPHRYPRFLPENGFKHDNVMLGCTTESQEYWSSRVAILRAAARDLTMRNRYQHSETAEGTRRQPVRTFASYEPALGPIVMGDGVKPDWVIFGGETGPHRRPVELAWAEAMRDECEEAGLPFWMKQLGGRTPDAAGAIIPASMLIRQFPGETK